MILRVVLPSCGFGRMPYSKCTRATSIRGISFLGEPIGTRVPRPHGQFDGIRTVKVDQRSRDASDAVVPARRKSEARDGPHHQASSVGAAPAVLAELGVLQVGICRDATCAVPLCLLTARAFDTTSDLE